MKFGRQVMPLKATLTLYSFKSRSFKHFRMADVQNSDVDVIPSPFSLAEQWVTIGKHS
jgi:hypothetical protein